VLAGALVAVLVTTTFVSVAGCLLRFTRPGVTLTVWDGPRWPDESGNRYHWMERKLEEFEAAHPFVEVVFVPVEWRDMRSLLDSAKEAGRLPDLAPFDLSSGGVSLAEVEAGLLEPADDLIADIDDLSPEARASYTHAGQLWGFPVAMTAHALLLNLDIFAERGVTPPADGKWTWDEFVETCRQLTFDRDGDRKTDVWGFATYVLPGYYEVWPFLYAGGARPLSEDLLDYTFDSPEAVAALEDLADLIHGQGFAHPSTGTAAVRTVFDLFARAEQQKVAIEPWSAWAIDYLRSEEGTIKNFAVAEYPTLTGVSNGGGPGGGAGVPGPDTAAPPVIGGTAGFVLFRHGDAYRRSQAAALANYLTSAASQYELARGYHVFPARRAAIDLDPFDGDPVYQKAAEIAFHAESLPKHPRWPEIERVIQREIQMVLLGIKDAAEALRDAGEVIQPILAPPPEIPPQDGDSPGGGEGG